MTELIKGMIIGSAVTVAALGGYAYGTNSGSHSNQIQYEYEALEREHCSVTVGSGRLSVGNQCRFNQVMVGTSTDYLLCADIRVTCP